MYDNMSLALHERNLVEKVAEGFNCQITNNFNKGFNKIT